MRRVALGLLIGMIILQQQSELPGLAMSFWLLLLLLAMYRFPRWRVLLSIGIGFCWASLFAHGILAGSLPLGLEGRDIVITGHIASLPDVTPRRTRFEFEPDAIADQPVPASIPGKVLLSWYGKAPYLEAGSRWQLQVRLKPAHGFMNPGGFDYESWLFGRGIRATGYVRGGYSRGLNRQLEAAAGHYRVHRLRQRLQQVLVRALGENKLQGVQMALAIGDRQQITPAQWEILTRTGTSHLVAISGLHVGLVAGFVFGLIQISWRRFPAAVLYWPARKAAAAGALFAAASYALLAGFSVPTQRAVIMIAVIMLAVILQRRVRPSQQLCLALILVLLWDPFSVQSAGFWLSFAAVAIIFYGMPGRIGLESGRWQRLWWRWGRLQWLVALGLLPLLVLLFNRASLVAPLANLVAVPWVSAVSVPLNLLGSLCVLFWPALGELLLAFSNQSLQVIWRLLEYLAQWPDVQWQSATPPGWILLSAALGIAWCCLPRGVPARWLGIIGIVPLILFRPAMIPEGQAQFTLLDVGQGLAAVVQTRRHVLVFDTGPRYGSGFNTGSAVLLPFLRARGIRRIDTLLVSHSDIDHRGGVAGLVGKIEIGRVLASAPQGVRGLESEHCLAGMAWQWDQVRFRVLHPQREDLRQGIRDNNLSCVLRVEAREQSLLLTGDIENEAEKQLIEVYGPGLQADILVVPHHGSKTSSSAAFLDTVQPGAALFPLGYGNRFGFPKPQVVQRYARIGAKQFDSARHGAIELRLGGGYVTENISAYRIRARRYWHHVP